MEFHLKNAKADLNRTTHYIDKECVFLKQVQPCAGNTEFPALATTPITMHVCTRGQGHVHTHVRTHTGWGRRGQE